MTLFPIIVRTAVTIALLVLVYQGSRVALVIVLGMLSVGMELSGWLHKWARERSEPPIDRVSREMLKRLTR